MEIDTILTVVVTSLSIIGCFAIYISHRVWKDIRSNSRNILLYITAADFLTAVGYLIGVICGSKSNRHICIAQSFVTTMSSMMSFFWTCGLALYLNFVSRAPSGESGRQVILVFHALSWPVPVIISLTALFADVFGVSNAVTTGWCWIRTDNCSLDNSNCTGLLSHGKSVLWMLLTGKFWEVISYILIIIAYARIWYHVRRQRQQIEDDTSFAMKRFRSVERRVLIVPLCFIIIRIWGTIRFFWYAINDGASDIFLRYLQAVGDGSQGFVNSVIFCLATQRATSLVQSCCRCDKEEDKTPLLPSPPK